MNTVSPLLTENVGSASPSLLSVEVLQVTFSERLAIQAAAEQQAEKYTREDRLTLARDATEPILQEAAVSAGHLPERLRDAVIRLRRRHQGCDALVIRGLSPQGRGDVAWTSPQAARGDSRMPSTELVEAILLLQIASLLGEPVAYAGTTPSESLLGGLPSMRIPDSTPEALRTENGLYPHGAERLLLRVAPRSAYVRIAISVLERARSGLSADAAAWLEKPLYWLRMRELNDIGFTKTLPVLEPHSSQRAMRIDTSAMDAMNGEAQQALNAFVEALWQTAWYFMLAPGDLVLLNNRTAAHAFLPVDKTDLYDVERLCISAN